MVQHADIDHTGLTGISSVELDYATRTSGINITGTTEGGATTVITGASTSFDGTAVWVEIFSPETLTPAGVNGQITMWLYEDGSSIGRIMNNASSGGSDYLPVYGKRKITPSAGSHTYSWRASVSTTSGTPYVGGGAGGAGNFPPAFMCITKV
jgi:hypothetical protein